MPSLNNLHSFAVSALRGGRGFIAFGAETTRQPQQPLELYEFESCPFCRKVREVFTELDLDYVSRTCARGSKSREKVVEMGGKAMFPFLVDPNTGTQMYESEDIISYLHTHYGSSPRSAVSKALSPINTITAAIASAVRPTGGGKVKSAPQDTQEPRELLELYNFEASPFCRKVREAMCALDLDYRLHNVGRKSLKRPDLVARGGRMMVPYLIDPNTGREMYESDDIVAYLHETYGAV